MNSSNLLCSVDTFYPLRSLARFTNMPHSWTTFNRSGLLVSTTPHAYKNDRVAAKRNEICNYDVSSRNVISYARRAHIKTDIAHRVRERSTRTRTKTTLVSSTGGNQRAYFLFFSFDSLFVSPLPLSLSAWAKSHFSSVVCRRLRIGFIFPRKCFIEVPCMPLCHWFFVLVHGHGSWHAVHIRQQYCLVSAAQKRSVAFASVRCTPMSGAVSSSPCKLNKSQTFLFGCQSLLQFSNRAKRLNIKRTIAVYIFTSFFMGIDGICAS